MERSHTDDVAYFVAFCVEMYKNAHNLAGADASGYLSEHGVMDYLAEHYDVLHTQSPAWILEEIESYIQDSQ